MQQIKIFTQKNVLLQAIQDAFRHGYSQHTSGTIPLARLEPAIAVFDLNYRAFADKNERARRVRIGLGNIRVFFYYRQGDNCVSWWLLAMPPAAGKHPVHSAEKLNDALDRDDRIVIFGLELVRLPKTETSVSKLTWRMTEDLYREMAQKIQDAVRSRSHWQMEKSITEVKSKIHGFNGARSQFGNLMVLFRREVKRASIKGAPEPPAKLSYIRRIRHDGISVKQLLIMIRHD